LTRPCSCELSITKQLGRIDAWPMAGSRQRLSSNVGSCRAQESTPAPSSFAADLRPAEVTLTSLEPFPPSCIWCALQPSSFHAVVHASRPLQLLRRRLPPLKWRMSRNWRGARCSPVSFQLIASFSRNTVIETLGICTGLELANAACSAIRATSAAISGVRRAEKGKRVSRVATKWSGVGGGPSAIKVRTKFSEL
jgi:hypothetical protein